MLARIAGSNSAGGMDVCVVSKGKMQDNQDDASPSEVHSVRPDTNTLLTSYCQALCVRF